MCVRVCACVCTLCCVVVATLGICIKQEPLPEASLLLVRASSRCRAAPCLQAYPYYTSVITLMAGFFITGLFFLYHK